MNVTPMIVKLREELVPDALAGVEPCDDINDAIALLKNNKASSFVSFTSEGASPNTAGTGITSQRVEYRFLVILGVAGAGLKNLAKGAGMEGLRDQVRDTLVGWTPQDAVEPIILRSSRVLLKDLDAALLFFGIEFSTAYYLRRNET